MNEKAVEQSKGSILSYICWRGDLSFQSDPWNEIDSLLMAEVAYVNFGENERTFDNPQRLLFADLLTTDILSRYPLRVPSNSLKDHSQLMPLLAKSRRFRNIRILDQVNKVDEERNMQFSALTLQVPDVGTVVAFRGTDPTVTGWKEDFMMSYECPVPAQAEAVKYLKAAADRTRGDLCLTGHSKGGNLALYAAAHSGAPVRSRLKAVCSFDGPGLDDATMESEGYKAILPVIHSVVPENSVIGLLMNYHPVYKVVESAAISILQHNPFSWIVLGKTFSELEDVSIQSRVIDRTMHEWLNACTPEQRRIFVHTVFSVLENRKRLKAGGTKPDNPSATDSAAMMMTLRLFSSLFLLQGKNTWFTRIANPLSESMSALRKSLTETGEHHFQSDRIAVDNRENGFSAVEDETRRIARFCGLNAKEGLQLQLFAEEMLSMVHAVSGEMQGTFWVENEKRRYDLHLETRTVMDRSKREMLLLSSSSRKNAAAGSFLGRLRDIFEKAMLSDWDEDYFQLSGERQSHPGISDQEWDRYEQSVLLRLADDVRIGIRGDKVSMTVTKTFPTARLEPSLP